MSETSPREAQRQALEPLAAHGWLLGRLASYAGWGFVRAVECVAVALQWLDPRLHFATLRVRAIIDGSLIKNSNKVAIFVVYSKGPLPAFTCNLIDSLNRSEFDLVVVSNGNLDARTKSNLLDRCRLLIERTNIGRDFGGYKDGIAIVMRRFPELRKLLLANDSVFYLPQGLDRLVAELTSEDEFIGVSEVFEHHYHVASFLVSFGKAALDSAAFGKFWARYRPVNTRRWSILRGEGALTETLIAAGFRPRVLYQSADLRQQLQRRTADQLLDEATSLPAAPRRKLLEKWPADATSARIAVDIADAIGARNQMHHGGFLFRRHLGLPVVKRDLVYRGIYSLQEALANLHGLDPPLFEEIAADFRARPKPVGLRWLFYRYGAI